MATICSNKHMDYGELSPYHDFVFNYLIFFCLNNYLQWKKLFSLLKKKIMTIMCISLLHFVKINSRY